MQRILTALIISLALLTGSSVYAHEPDGKRPDRKEWFKQLRSYKHDFLAKELSLTKEQQDKFFPLYDEMETKIHKVQHESMMLERKIDQSTTPVSDLEYEKAAEAMAEVKGKEAEIEGQYFTKFKCILKPKQMFELRKAERKFTNELMRQHSRMQGKRPNK